MGNGVYCDFRTFEDVLNQYAHAIEEATISKEKGFADNPWNSKIEEYKAELIKWFNDLTLHIDSAEKNLEHYREYAQRYLEFINAMGTMITNVNSKQKTTSIINVVKTVYDKGE